MSTFRRRLAGPSYRPQARSRSLGRTLVRVACAGLLCVACGGPQELGAAGTVCFRADDCQDGLACVPAAQGSSKRVCSHDLSGIVAMVEGAPAGGAPTAEGGAAGNGGGAPAEGSIAGAGP